MSDCDSFVGRQSPALVFGDNSIRSISCLPYTYGDWEAIEGRVFMRAFASESVCLVLLVALALVFVEAWLPSTTRKSSPLVQTRRSPLL